MKTLLRSIKAALVGAWKRGQLERELARLDPHMLRDIGLESWKGPQGAKLWAYRVGLY
ncbi:MAG TPA: DUF1127 domain-containing protein [Burkholderiales bacterium]|nr:DUF1127 domain-containing protein [Burkholderiales bacterium]